MPNVLLVGSTAISYSVSRSEVSSKRRIIVTPDTVEVIIPSGADEASAHAFIHARRRWVYEKREELLRLGGLDGPWPGRFVSGAKVMFRGRRMKLHVARSDRERGVRYSNGFYVHVPPYVKEGLEESYAKKALTAWLKERVRDDAREFAARYGRKIDLAPKDIRVKDQKHLWGSCGKDGIINLNWRLVFAPKPVLEYAVVHELCHLRHRNHDASFWSLLRSLLPDYPERKAWLEKNEKHVGADG
ncbi:M48 family metallopeptidase [Desulfovibrio psychrotolerans]|uniref:YgjP-like metallopeptidase domain-containing protein n=1 Tax=Desulfovibrio psychrotolerans TaxID=415242 RepID=A0A7J0BQL5_9BACT|nr:SprT family zinc-dependent metalloprotease [Desulfovibrio psychrotolerans]GFM35969.1 hypothetical protein DSM19430T_06530 [Desulfovibrio psychrotolerans]